MLKIPVAFPSTFAWLLLAMGGSAAAIGFGGAPAGAVLGQPLDVVVPLRLEPGETLEPRCVRAQVAIGDRTLPPDAVRTTVEPASGSRAAQLRIRTVPRVDEAVLTLDLSAGCVGPVVRRYVLFAEPSTRTDAAVAVPRPAAGETATADTAAAALTPTPSPRRAASDEGRAILRVAPSAARREPTPARVARAPAGRPRLQLDPLPAPPAAAGPTLDERTLKVVDEANEAVRTAIAAATAARDRISSLETSVTALRRETAQQRDLALEWQRRAEAAEVGSRWLWPLALLALALLALAGWLWSRLRALEDARRREWSDGGADGGAPGSRRGPAPVARSMPPPTPTVTSPAAAAQGLVRAQPSSDARGARPGAGLAPAHEPTPSQLPPVASARSDDTGVGAVGVAGAAAAASLAASSAAPPASVPSIPPRHAASTAAPTLASVDATRPILPRPGGHDARDVSAEELIDLEQQAEFFVVLGQDDAAIELLVSHLRDTGGASPLPYLKLLEIYRRQGDQDAYARTRERFNRRFNAHAPAWAASGHDGRSLEDYPKVLGWLQHVWPQPIDAMAVLEALLFRRDGGELFELPAYRELLFLYTLARDRLEPDATGALAAAVDVLLPLDDETADRDGGGRPAAAGRAFDEADDEPSTAAGALEAARGGGLHPGSSRFGEL